MKSGKNSQRGGMAGLAGMLMALVIFLCAQATAAPRNPDGVAVIIGNADYTHDRVPDVSYAGRDAAAFKRYVIDVLGYDPVNIIDLRDATQAQMMAAFGNRDTHKGKLWRYLDPAGKSDVVVFYSGHGVPGQRSGRGYLLPVNADPDAAEINGYPIDLLYENLGKLQAAKSIALFLDACFSGDSHKGMLVRSASPVFMKVALPKAARRMTVLTAASGAQLASWDEKAKHGLFTHHLLDALYGKADVNKDGRVTALEAKKYLDRYMTRAARRAYGRDQFASLNGATDAALSVAPGKAFPRRPIELAALPPKPSRSAAVSPPAVVSPDGLSAERALGLKRADRVLIQRGLNGLKLDAGPADGLYGPKTRDAVRKWQVSKGYSGTGYLTRDQAKALVATGRETKVAIGVYPGSPGVFPAPSRSVRRPGMVFRDCGDCPELVVIPPGSFRMGDVSGGGLADEKPVHGVTIPRSFAVGKFEVTKGEFARFVGATGHQTGGSCQVYNGKQWEDKKGYGWRNAGFGQTDRDPVVCVNWGDARSYIEWLSRKTGRVYRLLSESEWEYVARAGSSSKYSFGDSKSDLCKHGNAADQSTDISWRNQSCSDGYGKQTSPVGSFRPNRFGIYDTVGNVWEWVGDCYNGSYAGAPSDGSAWTGGDCTRRVLRGGSWDNEPRIVRSAFRIGIHSAIRGSDGGFRLARTL
jgi:formylglycine-generating enzyme required for sulfatase activity